LAKIVLGPASVELGKKVAQELGADAISVEAKSFPDGESYIRIVDDISGERVIVAQSTYSPQDKHLMQLLLLLDAARDLKASEIIAVVPYFAYSRQDKRFRLGEAVSVETVVKLIEAAGADSFVTVDVHTEKILNLFKIRAMNVSAMATIGKYFSRFKLKEPYVLAPDEGSVDRARTVAGQLAAEYSFFQKQRDRVTGTIKTEARDVDIKDRDVVIVDDIISTGLTIANVASILREQGARTIYVACTHPLLLPGAKEKIFAAGASEIVGTDCIQSDVSRISVASVIAESLRKIM